MSQTYQPKKRKRARSHGFSKAPKGGRWPQGTRSPPPQRTSTHCSVRLLRHHALKTEALTCKRGTNSACRWALYTLRAIPGQISCGRIHTAHCGSRLKKGGTLVGRKEQTATPSIQGLYNTKTSPHRPNSLICRSCTIVIYVPNIPS